MSRPDPAGAALPPTIWIVGPTAAGKSDLALDAALRFGGEVISCDSMAVYRGLDIGTDKPSLEARRLVPHHLIDVAQPGSCFSAGAFRNMALEAMAGIADRDHLAVVVGGTGLYYRALAEGLAPLPPRDEGLRARIAARIASGGPERAHRLLARLDPAAASRIGLRDSLRITRALEVRILTGLPISRCLSESPFGSAPSLGGLKLGLTAPRAYLYTRTDRRVRAMMEAGLLEEVRQLHSSGQLTGPARKAIGYGELADYLEGLMTLESAVARIQLRSRRLVKRQLTWFRREDGILWFSVDKEAWKNDAMEFIKRWHSEAGRKP